MAIKQRGVEDKLKMVLDKINEKVLFYCLLIFALLIVVLGLVISPSFVSRHLSPDSIVGKATIVKIYFIKLFVLTIGIILFFYSLIGIIRSDYAKRTIKKVLGYIKKIDEKANFILIFLKFYKKDDSLLLKRVILIWVTFLITLLVSGVLDVSFSWKEAEGYEYLWIAESIEAGHGFSFLSCRRWQFKPTPPCDKYYPTAHEEPVYPYLMAFATKVLGKYSRLAILILQVFALFLTSIVIFHIARKVFNYSTGILAGLILPLLPGLYSLKNSFSPVMFAGLIISISTYLLIGCLEKVSVRRGSILGFVLGLSSLIYAAILPFIPLSVFFVFISKSTHRSAALKSAVAVLLVAVIIMSGWTIRNLIVFEQFVPVRTAFGISLYFSNAVLASTYSSKDYGCSDKLGNIWKAKNAKEAIMVSSTSLEKQSAIYKRARECIELDAPEGYEYYNEPERDKFYLDKALEFIFHEPLSFLVLTYNRIMAFFFYLFDRSKGVIALLFLVGALITLSNQRARVLSLLTVAYLIPYFLIVSWWYRYRYPIEPILLLFASYVPVFIVSKFCVLLKSYRSK